jgi:SAM-dependent methyltransferase
VDQARIDQGRIPTYVIRGGSQGRERLRALARLMAPTTDALFDRVGIATDARCLDVGCGGGDVTVALARRVPHGRVLGMDLDDTQLDLARKEAEAGGFGNVDYRVADAMTRPSDDDAGAYDAIYVRFVLTHLPDPDGALENITVQLAPGGVLIVEDIDFRGHFCDPDVPSFWKMVDWYTRAVQARGCDPNIGPRLPGMLRRASLTDVDVHVVQPAGYSTDLKSLQALTLERIADAVLSSRIAELAEFEATVDDLYAAAHDDDVLLSLPRIVQTWGRRAA